MTALPRDSNRSFASFDLTLNSCSSTISLLSSSSISSLESAASRRRSMARGRRRNSKSRWQTGNGSTGSVSKCTLRAPRRQSSNPFLLGDSPGTAPRVPRRKRSNPNFLGLEQSNSNVAFPRRQKSRSSLMIDDDGSEHEGSATLALAEATSAQFQTSKDSFRFVEELLSSMPPPPVGGSPSSVRKDSFRELRNAFSAARV